MSSYEEIWKSAQEKAKEGDFKAALAHYLQCEALFADEDKSEAGDGRYLHLQNSIVYAAFKAGNAGEAHSAWITAIKRADPKTDHGLTSIIWLSSMIPHIESLMARKGKKTIKKDFCWTILPDRSLSSALSTDSAYSLNWMPPRTVIKARTECQRSFCLPGNRLDKRQMA
jgi:hypothetical protein